MKPKAALSVTNPDRLRYFRWIAAALAILLAVATVLSWPAFAARFGPMTRQESQCLICNRQRIQESLTGQPTHDEIIENEYSAWVDTFVPASHQHVWSGSTRYDRRHWFGGKSIACGGIAVLAWIYRRREDLGEEKCRQLALKFHELVRDPAPVADQYKRYDEFGRAVTDDPESLLADEAEEEADEE
jgi:hypothetical protein